MGLQRLYVFPLIALASVALLSAGSANAASITYYLSQSNDAEGWLPDGTQDYLSVTIADSTTVADDIDVTVEILFPLTNIADANFGIDSFVFNSTNTLTAGDIIGIPGDWGISLDYDPSGPHLTGDGFGRFEIGLDAGTRQSPTLAFSISKAGDSLADYAVLSTNGSQGDTFFAVHVAGFFDQDADAPLDPIDIGNPGVGQCYDTDGQGNYTAGCNILTSAWFGGNSTTPAGVPEPFSALLLGAGLLSVGWIGRRRRS